MASFLTKQFSLSTSITKLVDKADFDRSVTILGSSSALMLAFDGSGDEVEYNGLTNFRLPQGVELWARSTDAGNPGTVDLIVTR